jgi:hypothetical protein
MPAEQHEARVLRYSANHGPREVVKATDAKWGDLKPPRTASCRLQQRTGAEREPERAVHGRANAAGRVVVWHVPVRQHQRSLGTAGKVHARRNRLQHAVHIDGRSGRPVRRSVYSNVVSPKAPGYASGRHRRACGRRPGDERERRDDHGPHRGPAGLPAPEHHDGTVRTHAVDWRRVTRGRPREGGGLGRMRGPGPQAVAAAHRSVVAMMSWSRGRNALCCA